MKQILTTLVFIMLCVGGLAYAQDPTAGSVGVGDPIFPTAGNGGYDVQHYTLTIDVDVANNSILAVASIEAIATQNLSAFNLDFAGLTVDSLVVNGESAQFSRDGRELTVTPVDSLVNGTDFIVEIAYSGEPNADTTTSDGVDVMFGWNNIDNGATIFVGSEPEGSATWYPVNDHPSDKATYTYRITVPKPYVVAANGVLEETIDNGDTLTYHWEARDPMATYLSMIAIHPFEVTTETGPNGLIIRNYISPDATEATTDALAHTSDMITFFSEIFGPYPFETYGVVVISADNFYALENQTMSVITSYVFRLSNIQGVLAHELAHQWLGNSVSPATWQDIWLNEGMAKYAEWMWIEHSQGHNEFDSIIMEFYDILANNNFDTVVGQPTDIASMFSYQTYYRGAWTLHMLREQVGTEVFVDILRTYTEQYHDSNARTEDFIAVAESVSGQDLTEFFDMWLYQSELPPIPE